MVQPQQKSITLSSSRSRLHYTYKTTLNNVVDPCIGLNCAVFYVPANTV